MAATTLKILLVEDSPILSAKLAAVLQGIEHADLVGTVDTEADAVHLLKTRAVDVVILDLHLKQGTGFGVMRALAPLDIKPRIMVLTNYDLPEYRDAAFSLGASEVLDKMFDYARIPGLLMETRLQTH
jgi:two-component system OmpR family response regulator